MKNLDSTFDVEIVVLATGGHNRNVPECGRISSDRRQNVVAKWTEEHIDRSFDVEIEGSQWSDRTRTVRITIVDSELVLRIQMFERVDRLYGALRLAGVD